MSILKKTLHAFCLIILFALSNPLNAEISVHGIFCDNMVLQRNAVVPVWGWGDPGESINLHFNDFNYETKVDNEGTWKIHLHPSTEGGPHEMIIISSNTIKIKNIMYGEVWFCSGQSNMFYTPNMLGDPVKNRIKTDHVNMRLFNVPLEMDYRRRNNLTGGEWKLATKEEIGNFSAVAYFFGAELEKNLDVPVGLICSSLGASFIEAWMSTAALKKFPQFEKIIESNLSSGKNYNELKKDLIEFRKTWDIKYYLKGVGIEKNWQNPSTDVSQWKEVSVPGFWRDYGFENHDGAIWYRKEFDLPEGFAESHFNIQLNQIDDYDICWVNGHKVGESFGKRNFRSYLVPIEKLQAKNNVLVVRVFDIGGTGGMFTNAFWGNPILNGKWKIKPGLKIDPKSFPTPEVAQGSPFSHPSLLYNGSVAPLQAFPIKGVIWYQGESNIHRAVEYKGLLLEMITSWRADWGIGDFPFLIVQLANHMSEDELPKDSKWAEVREAQSSAMQLKNVATVATIDIGEANDIHPKNKWDIGSRLCLAARNLAYREKINFLGPRFKSMKIHGNKIKILMNSNSSGLTVKDKYGYIRGFATAGKDQVFHWAQAYLEGDEIVVYHQADSSPLAVRYCWSDNPGQVNLFNMDGLPAFPFRTDNWVLSTQGQLFHYDEHSF